MKLFIPLWGIFVFPFSHHLYTQYQYYSCSTGGKLSSFDLVTGEHREIGTYVSFPDIAVTPDGFIWGATDFLYRIDPVTGTATPINYLMTFNGGIVAGIGLVGLNNDFLVGAFYNTLFKVSTHNAYTEVLGIMDYAVLGDLAFLNDTLYMISDIGHLIRIRLNDGADAIISAEDMGYMGFDAPLFSLFTAFPSCLQEKKELFAIAYDSIFLINTKTAQATFFGKTGDNLQSGGAASQGDYFPDGTSDLSLANIFTPNGDGINDMYGLANETYLFDTFYARIYNRWGIEINSSHDPFAIWDGNTVDMQPVPDGVYYCLVEYTTSSCSMVRRQFVTLTLSR